MKLHQHFQNDLELALRIVKIKTILIKAYASWAKKKSILFELLQTINSATYLDSAPAFKAEHILKMEILGSYKSFDWWRRKRIEMIRIMFLPYEERQRLFIKIFNLKIGDRMYVSPIDRHLGFSIFMDIPLLQSLAEDRTTVTIVSFEESFIVLSFVKHNTSEFIYFKAPYSILYKIDGSIIYPKKTKA